MKQNGILFVAIFFSLTLSAQAGGSPEPFERFKPDVVRSQEVYKFYESDRVVADSKSHAVVRQDAGNSCAAGSFFLVNKKAKTYLAIDAGTCDDRGFSVLLTNDQLVFRQNKRITALYPVYAN